MPRILRHAATLVALTFRRSRSVRMSRMAASLAFYSIFSLSPLVMVAIALGAIFLGERVARAATSEKIRALMGEQEADAVMSFVNNAMRLNQRVTITAVGVAIVAWAATRVFMELRSAMNDIWAVDRAGRNRLRVALVDRIFSFAMILLTGVALLASTIASTVMEALRHHLANAIPAVDMAMSRLGYPIGSFVIIALLFGLVFKILPACRIAWGDVWLGALLSAALFTLGKYLIGLYLSRTTVVSVYGAAGSLVVLLLWIYYSSQIFLLGAVFSAVYSERVGSRKHLHTAS